MRIYVYALSEYLILLSALTDQENGDVKNSFYEESVRVFDRFHE
jgi:hypothetical protein